MSQKKFSGVKFIPTYLTRNIKLGFDFIRVYEFRAFLKVMVLLLLIDLVLGKTEFALVVEFIRVRNHMVVRKNTPKLFLTKITFKFLAILRVNSSNVIIELAQLDFGDSTKAALVLQVDLVLIKNVTVAKFGVGKPQITMQTRVRLLSSVSI